MSIIPLIIAELVAGLFIYKILSKIQGKLAGVLGLALWYFNPRVVWLSLMGVEGPLKILFISMVVWLLVRDGENASPWKIGILMMLASATRLDGIFFVAIVAVWAYLKFKWDIRKILWLVRKTR